jgi:hypothetical protein
MVLITSGQWVTALEKTLRSADAPRKQVTSLTLTFQFLHFTSATKHIDEEDQRILRELRSGISGGRVRLRQLVEAKLGEYGMDNVHDEQFARAGQWTVSKTAPLNC